MAPSAASERSASVGTGPSNYVEDVLRGNRFDEHRKKVDAARSGVNNGWSVREVDKLQSSVQNPKRDQLREERIGQIERENKRLLSKMQEIHRRTPGQGLGKLTANMVLESRCGPTGRSSSTPAVRKQNITPARMAELRRIDEDNKRMLKKIQGAKPSINRAKLEEAHHEQQRLMRMRCCEQQAPHFSGNALGSDPAALARKRRMNRAAALGWNAKQADAAARYEQHLEGMPYLGMVSPTSHGWEGEQQLPEYGLDENSDRRTPLSEDAAVAAAEGKESEEETQSSDSKLPRRELLGGEIPTTSKSLVQSLMEERFGDNVLLEEDELGDGPAVSAPSAGLAAQVQSDEDFEREAAAAKEAAALAFQQAKALDVNVDGNPWNGGPGGGARGGHEALSYEDVVQWSRARRAMDQPPAAGRLGAAW